MTDATPAEPAGRADGGAGSDSAETAYEWRAVTAADDEIMHVSSPLNEQHVRYICGDNAALTDSETGITYRTYAQRRRVGPWEDVD